MGAIVGSAIVIIVQYTAHYINHDRTSSECIVVIIDQSGSVSQR